MTFHMGQCIMDSLMGQSGRQKRGGEVVFTFMHCKDVRRIRDIAKGIAIKSTRMGKVAKVSEVISVDRRMVI